MKCVAALLGALLAIAGGTPAGAAECTRVVVYTLPGVTWEQVQRVEPPALMDAIESGAAGSVSVRTNAPRTSYASGFATIGAGARVDGGTISGGPAFGTPPHDMWARNVRVGGFEEIEQLADGQGYNARPGALGAALTEIPVTAVGNADLGAPLAPPVRPGRWSLLAAMDARGVVDRAATGPGLLRKAARWPSGVRTDPAVFADVLTESLGARCGVTIVDQGDLIRAENYVDAHALAGSGSLNLAHETLDRALLAADRALGTALAGLDFDKDLLLVLAPTSPLWQRRAHLGVAVAVGPQFEAGSFLSSPSTRRPGILTLVDIAPTILEHLGIARPAPMTGRALGDVDNSANPVSAGVELDSETVFVDRLKSGTSTAFVVFQVLVYVLAVLLLLRRSPVAVRGKPARAVESAGLAVVAFPAATYLSGPWPLHELGVGGMIALLVVTTALLVVATTRAARRPLDRLLVLTSFTAGILAIDLMSGSRLQLNTVFGYSPIIAGRFSGAGNITFAVLGATSLLTGALIVHRAGGSRRALAVAAVIFAVAVVTDGMPQFGSDVGGVIALVPALGFTWALLAGKRPSWKLVAGGVVAGVLIVGLFLVVDLARPPDKRTHLARLYEDVSERGVEVLFDTIARKARANLRVFVSTIWTLFVPPALAILASFLFRPRGRWRAIESTVPHVRAGLIGGLLLAVLGLAVNDSGIVIPAVVLSFLVPLSMLVMLSLEESGLGT